MTDKQQDKHFKTMAILALLSNPWVLIVLLVIIVSLLSAIFDEKIDPMDDSINKRPMTFPALIVRDTAGNGFRIVYRTVNPVTEERYKEIKDRPHIQEGWRKLKEDAPKHFGNMLYTDIYDFAIFAKQYDSDPDVKIHNIFVDGKKKMDLYVQPNPNIPDCALWMDFLKQQGNLYVESNDIYFMAPPGQRKYRYWKCYGNNSFSLTDEQFSHFSKKERID